MEWQERLNAAIDYIEAELDGEVDWAEAASRANCSTFHFLRMFEVVAGLGAGEYLRRRRLSRAAQELARGEARIIDLALRYGYDSPDSFTKAFKRLFGLSPSAAREPGARLSAYGPLRISVVLKGAEAMEYRIVEKDAFSLAGPAIRTTAMEELSYREIPAFWGRLYATGEIRELGTAVPAGSELGICGVCVCLPEAKNGEFEYLAAVELRGEGASLKPGWERVEVPASTWGVFPSRGPLPGSIQAVWKRFFSEWLPGSGWEHAGGPELEVYGDGDTNAPDYYSEVWVPLVKKA